MRCRELNRAAGPWWAPAFVVALSLLATGAVHAGARRDLSAITAGGGASGPRAQAELFFRKLGALGRHTPLVRVRIERPGSAPATRFAPAKRGAPLTFKFEGFTAQQLTDFGAFRDTAYPQMVVLYGEPAPAQQGKSVRVKFDATAGDGIYQLPSPTVPGDGGTILYTPVTTSDGFTPEEAKRVNNYNLARQMLIAFHGPLIFGSDAWELGFADAAAIQIAFQTQGRPASFDPSQLGVYLLPNYDLFNRPELGNRFFFSTGTSAKLGFFRAGMAQSAWLKVFLESGAGDFFRRFNTTYYSQAAAATTGVPLPDNTPALKLIAGQLVPLVEGLQFNDWYRRQYVLDNAVTTGEKLWVALIPLPNLTAGDTRSVVFGAVQHYRTLPNGDEQPIAGGIGAVTATDEKEIDITARSAELNADNQLIFNSLGEAEINAQNTSVNALPTIGFRNTGTPDQGRITLHAKVGEAEATGYFPYGVAGTETRPNGFLGATLGTNAGQVRIQVRNGITANAALARGAFPSAATYPTGARVITTFTLTPSDGAAGRTLQRNAAWSILGTQAQSLVVLLETAPGNVPVSLNLPVSSGNQLRMFSLPLFPVQSDEAAVLSLDPRTLLLARYRTALAPLTFTQGGIQFGITADKYELYPNIAEPFAPGRGYWLRTALPFSTTVRGGEPSRARPYEVPLIGGWNQFGVPFNRSFTVGQLRVRRGDEVPVSFGGAIGQGLVGPGIWRWKPEGGYARVDSGPAAGQVLQPFEGYFIFTAQPRGVNLVFDTAAAQTASAAASGEWRLAIAASSGARRDADNAVGVTTLTGGKPRTMPAAKPPPGESALTLSFFSGGSAAADNTGAGAASGWAESLVPPFSNAAVWRFLVDGAAPGSMVRLTWGDPRAVPSGIALTLVDEATGRRTPLTANAAGYTFTAGTGPATFRIEARALPSPIVDLRFQLFLASKLGIASAQLSRPGTITVTVVDSHNVPVRNLAVRQSVNVGRSYWFWDMRDESYRPVPHGRYTVRAQITDANGYSYEAERGFSF